MRCDCITSCFRCRQCQRFFEFHYWPRSNKLGKLIAAFQAMSRTKNEDALDNWTEQAKAALVASFANGVEKDGAAIFAAITNPRRLSVKPQEAALGVGDYAAEAIFACDTGGEAEIPGVRRCSLRTFKVTTKARQTRSLARLPKQALQPAISL